MTEAQRTTSKASHSGLQPVEEEPKRAVSSFHAVGTVASLAASLGRHTTDRKQNAEGLTETDEDEEGAALKPNLSVRSSQRRLSQRSSETSKHVESFATAPPQKPGGHRILKYPVECFVPESPTLALPAKSLNEWQMRVEQVNEAEGCETASEPKLLWYGCELERVCAQALLSSAGQVIRLQSHLAVDPGHWEAGGKLWEQLLESCTQFSAVSYAVEKISKAIVSQDGSEARENDHEHAQGSGNHASRAPADRLRLLRARCFQRSEAQAQPRLRAWVQPRTADEALADMQAQISQLQAAGLPLSVLLRRLQAAELPRLLEDKALVSQLFLVVPCLERAVVRLQHLTAFAIRIQEDAWLLRVPPNESEPQEGSVPASVTQELSHEVEEVVEVGKLLEPLPGEEIGAKPAEAGADTEREETQQHQDSQQDADVPLEANTSSKSDSKSASSLSRSLKKVKTQKLVTAKSKPKR